jgi:prepilin-type N-terminal cleavage/methylation domain-containing protein
MNSPKIKNAFTLIELMVWITIIAIILLWSSNLDFNRLNTKQKLDIFTNNIKSNFETIRNSSLLWKWIWTDLSLPDKWKIEYSTSNSWTIVNSTYSWSRSELDNNLIFKPGFSISNIKCLQLDWITQNKDLSTSWTWIIEFIWSEMKFIWDCTEHITSKILELKVKNKSETKILQINTLNWLVEIK